MNLFYCQASFYTVNLDLMVVAGDVETAREVWRRVVRVDLDEAEMSVATCEPFVIDVHLSRPEQGYIEPRTFRLIPVELP